MRRRRIRTCAAARRDAVRASSSTTNQPGRDAERARRPAFFGRRRLRRLQRRTRLTDRRGHAATRCSSSRSPRARQAGSFTVNSPGRRAIDLDLYVYRAPAGRLDRRRARSPPRPRGDDTEDATYIADDPRQPVEPDTYVDRTSTTGARARRPTTTRRSSDPAATADCGMRRAGPGPRTRTTSAARSTFGAAREDEPAAVGDPQRSGRGRAASALTFTGAGQDPDGQIVELQLRPRRRRPLRDDLASAQCRRSRSFRPRRASTTSACRSPTTSGGTAYASKCGADHGPGDHARRRRRVAPKAVAADSAAQLQAQLDPVFGGRKGVALVVRYRLRKRLARRPGALPRQEKSAASRGSHPGSSEANKTYRIKVKPKGLAQGAATRRGSRVRPTEAASARIYTLVSSQAPLGDDGHRQGGSGTRPPCR